MPPLISCAVVSGFQKWSCYSLSHIDAICHMTVQLAPPRILAGLETCCSQTNVGEGTLGHSESQAREVLCPFSFFLSRSQPCPCHMIKPMLACWRMRDKWPGHLMTPASSQPTLKAELSSSPAANQMQEDQRATQLSLIYICNRKDSELNKWSLF